MAIGDPYATRAQLKARVGIATSNTGEDTNLDLALSTAAYGIEQATDRQFNLAGTVTARHYEPDSTTEVSTADIATTVGLVVEVDTSADGTYATTWAASDYELRPLDGIVSGQLGWPYWRICAVGNYLFPSIWRRAPVRVTANWGWASVPTPIQTATLILAEELFKLKDSPFGSGGYGQFGIIRARQNPMVWTRIQPYARNAVLVA
jgi:hypothetical protein